MTENTSQTSNTFAVQQRMVVCPKHGEHEYAITSTIPGYEGAWCQLCWMESLGPSLPYKTKFIESEFKTMDQVSPLQEVGWKTIPKE